jgi:hypothetical protein
MKAFSLFSGVGGFGGLSIKYYKTIVFIFWLLVAV